MNVRLQTVVARVLRVDPGSVTATSTMDNCPSWVSLAHVELMVAIEQEFGVTIDEDAMFDLVGVEEIERYLEKHLPQDERAPRR